MDNVLKSRGVRNGDRVTIYMAMCLLSDYAILVFARI